MSGETVLLIGAILLDVAALLYFLTQAGRAVEASLTQPGQSWAEREAPAASERWRKSNAEKRAAGCKCGAPATHVRKMPHVIGSVPAEIWTCAAHVNVNGWQSTVNGGWEPSLSDKGFDTPAMRPWAGWVEQVNA